METTEALTVGTIVKYHGSITSEHWSTFYVADTDEQGRYTIIDRDYPQVTTLRQVRRASITPTGETTELCACGHEVAYTLRDEPGVCGACGWTCHNHRALEA